MRKGRFAGLSEEGRGDEVPLGASDLLLFDLRPARGAHDDRVAQERVRSLAHSAPFLATTHFGCAVALLLALSSMGAMPNPLHFYGPVAAVLLLDLRLWQLSSRRGDKAYAPHRIVRAAGLYAVLGSLLWILLVDAVIGGQPIGPSVRAPLIAGMAAPLVAFMSIPGLILVSCVMAVGAAAWFGMQMPMFALISLASASLLGLSLLRARDSLRWAHRRVTLDWQALQAGRFVADFEESGRGWFWETNADGALTYVSAALARQLGRDHDELIGKSFDQLLLVEDSGGGKPQLGFHLNARFPFSEVIVTPNGQRNVSWSIAGSPNFDELGRFLGFRGIAANLSEQRRSEAETSRMARLDPLTGLANRAAMRSMLDAALRNAESRREGCALLLVDLDRFKAVNDTLGHPIGDALLKEVAQRLSLVVGELGQVGRLGGDEFEAVLPGVDEEGTLASLSDRLIREVTKPYHIKGNKVAIGASVGISIARPGRTYADALIREADLALYAAKAAGRGTFRFFEPEMDSEATARKVLEKDLAAAVQLGQMRLLFQPIVDAASEDLTGFEALVRWQHPTRGLLAPAEFLPVAEDSGLAGLMGEWILRTALAAAAKWPKHLRLTVNLSAAQCAEAALPSKVANALGASGFAPDRLVLDVREEALLASSTAGELFAQLSGLGVRLALDDFGTGYSSIATLKAAPLDAIKLHQSFIRGAAGPNNRNRAVTAAVVGLAESLGMDVTAEGAETLEDLAIIRELGCRQVQGYLFGRPMAADEALAMAAESKPVSAREAQPARPPRHRLIRRGRLQWKGQSMEVRLRNISAGGAMVESPRPLKAGESVSLDLSDGIVVDAQVRWAQEDRLGIRFAEAFDLQCLGQARGSKADQKMLRPSYLDTETSPGSPWAARKERLSIKDVRRA